MTPDKPTPALAIRAVSTMPIRAEFASRFMAGLLSRDQVSIYGASDLAARAVRLADALILQLNEPTEP